MIHDPVEEQLKSNELGKLAIKSQPFLETYGNLLLGGIGAAIVIVLVASWTLYSQRQGQAVAWTMLAAAQTQEMTDPGGAAVEEYANVAESYRSTAAGQWARLRECELLLDSGIQNMFINREAALADLKRAQTGLEEVLSPGSPAVAECRERAQFRLGQVLETTSQGDTKPAIEAYRKVLADFPDTIFKTTVEERIADLEKGSTKSFYEWFAAQAPKPPEIRGPRDGSAAPQDPFKELTSGAGSTAPATTTTAAPAATAPTTEGASPTTDTPPTAPTSDAAAAPEASATPAASTEASAGADGAPAEPAAPAAPATAPEGTAPVQP